SLSAGPIIAPVSTAHSIISLHDALPIWVGNVDEHRQAQLARNGPQRIQPGIVNIDQRAVLVTHVQAERLPDFQAVRAACHLLTRSEEHTSELQSRENLVCRLLLEKKKIL